MWIHVHTYLSNHLFEWEDNTCVNCTHALVSSLPSSALTKLQVRCYQQHCQCTRLKLLTVCSWNYVEAVQVQRGVGLIIFCKGFSRIFSFFYENHFSNHYQKSLHTIPDNSGCFDICFMYVHSKLQKSGGRKIIKMRKISMRNNKCVPVCALHIRHTN